MKKLILLSFAFATLSLAAQENQENKTPVKLSLTEGIYPLFYTMPSHHLEMGILE